jgi:hypothetical protein
MMSRRIGIVLVFASLAAACDRPTAPEAREIARKVEQRFAEGDFEGIGNMFSGTRGQFAYQVRKNDALEIARNGASETINGYVIEEILVAPHGIGRPRIRRTLIGWPDDFAFALHATTDAAAGYLALVQDSQPRLLSRNGITVNFRTRASALIGLDGEVEIGEPLLDRECGTAKVLPPMIHRESGVLCNFALYEVDVRGELARASDLHNPLLKSFQRRQHLRIVRQRVPGVRFVITCPDFKPLDRFGEEGFEAHNLECREAIHFWRDRDLFAPALGVDVAQMRPVGGAEGVDVWYVRKTKGQGKDWDGKQRWTIHSPDGRLLESDSGGPLMTNPSRRDLSEWMLKLQATIDDRRIQALIPATEIDSSASRYARVVLDMQLTTPVEKPR